MTQQWDSSTSKDFKAPPPTPGDDNLLTIASNTKWWWMGPGSRVGTDDGGRSICSVARLTPVGQQGSWWKRSPVCLRLVQQVSVLHAGRPRTTWRQNQMKRISVRRLEGEMRGLCLRLHSGLVIIWCLQSQKPSGPHLGKQSSEPHFNNVP